MKLYPRLALYEALAGFKDEHKRRQPSTNATCEARRDFLDSFAYLCDVQKGGATVTATALQKLPHSNIMWLAANEGIREDVLDYAQTLVKKLTAVTPASQQPVKDEIFGLAVEKCSLRIKYYKVEVQKYATACRMALRYRDRNDVGAVSS